MVVTVEKGKITGREMLERVDEAEQALPHQNMAGLGRRQLKLQSSEQAQHHEHHDSGSGSHQHHNTFDQMADCDLVLSRVMGTGMYGRLQQANLKTILTDIMDVDEAVMAYLEGNLQNHPELTH